MSNSLPARPELVEGFERPNNIKAIIGLGNPGPQYFYTRHNIGFRVVDFIAEQFNVSWQKKDRAEIAIIKYNDQDIILLKPQTFMNDSGKALAMLTKKGIKPEEILVAHDELELDFGKLKLKFGTSAKGHNGLRSIIETIGKDFHRLAFGISRPANREDVPDYVLSNFSKVQEQQIPQLMQQSAELILKKGV